MPHPFTLRSETVDYGFVFEGEITRVLDAGEILVRAGDVVVQRGTSHAWVSRSGRRGRVAFIPIDGAFDPELVEPADDQAANS